VEVDPATGEVVRTGTLPEPVSRAAAASTGKAIYVFGGWNRGSSDTVVVVDPTTLSSSEVTTLPFTGADLAAVACSGKIYLFGGADPKFHQQIRIVEFDPVSRDIVYVHLRHFLWW
jgi:N-acetylneuraminic acid mutarotase